MRLSTATPFSTVLVLFSFFQAISALTLAIFQQINGFDTACTNAYNTPLTDCSNSDFSGQGCSAKCIGFLDSLTKTLGDVCAGTSAYPNTLIGLFFVNEGVQTLCSNAGGSSSSSGGGNGDGQSGGQDGAYDTQSAAGEPSASTTSTSTSSAISSSTTSTSSTPQAAATSSTPQAAATSSTTTIVPTTVTPEPTITSVAVVGTTVTPESPSDTSTSTSHTKSSTSTSSTSASTSNGNGGGTPLDIGSSAACHDAAVSVWLFAILVGSAGMAWLL